MRRLASLIGICLVSAVPVMAQPSTHHAPHNVPPATTPHAAAPAPVPRGINGRMSIPQPNHGGAHVALTERRWRDGHWYHGLHSGRSGWWWTTGPEWFFYDSPIYPFPDVYGPAGAELGWWYWCDAYNDYYPYVTRCPSGWRRVPPR